MYLPHMSKNTFSCQVITKSHPYKSDNQTLQQMSSKYFASTETISSINNRSWFQIRFSRCYWVSAMLYLLVFELRIGSGQKLSPPQFSVTAPRWIHHSLELAPLSKQRILQLFFLTISSPKVKLDFWIEDIWAFSYCHSMATLKPSPAKFTHLVIGGPSKCSRCWNVATT